MTTDKLPSNGNPDENQQEFWGVSTTEEQNPVMTRYDAKKDPYIYRVAATTLAFTAISGVLAGIFLPIFGKTVPDQVWMLSSAAAGAFAVLLKIDR
jgi:hypothetical protein